MYSRLGHRMVNRRLYQVRRNYSFWNKFTNSFWHRLSGENKTPKPDDPNTLIKALHEHEPWFDQEKRTHHKVQEETTVSVVDAVKFQALLSRATQNLALWNHDKQPSPHQIEVFRGDWGEVAQRETRKYGEIYAVLNMANAYFVGGAFLDGGGAQEENMFARTSCSNHILAEGSHIYLDKNNVYRYKPEMTDLINAKTRMTPDELARLSAICGKIIDHAYKVHMDTQEPEVCFRGPELFANIQGSGFFDEPKSSGRIALSVKDGSFAYLSDSEIFPFHELRSAAIDLTDTDIEADWNDREFVEWFKKETKRRIDAQLDTVLLNGIRHAVLCAFGCGAFKNRAEEVAGIYRESIEERAVHFEHIVFAIYHPGYGRDNFPAFEKELHGLPLGAKARLNLEKSIRLGFKE
ncbi:hypothetical protein AQUSIP_07360 [Aquicella siphonis]|uniref:Microbial-type PARG catalytic domain-containing protein n=1 Tax=Aquicella siphonis TaxID=254247 RepID=A0A5E4PGG2_9COXI|nr:poly(ADP-ribose) glycohydrolase domain-containing protein [Aquicella siphonis]VVC75446.1 hypothetical protein AQUSIP_07360 [Aquicella siphonis]